MVYYFGMNVNYRSLEDMMLDVIHTLESEPDDTERMLFASKLYLITKSRLANIRNEAAYEARGKHAAIKLSEHTSLDAKTISEWSHSWADKKGLPRRNRSLTRPWNVGFRNLSGG
jgi:hypothetical protein